MISGPLTLGWAIFSLYIVRDKKTKVAYIFLGFQKLGTAIATFFLQFVFVFLWALLFIVPGVIAALSYSQAYFLIADNENIGPLDAIIQSKRLMSGLKWKLFCLVCRFIGWFILSVLTLGIGLIWLTPYMLVSFAHFYEEIISNKNKEMVANPK